MYVLEYFSYFLKLYKPSSLRISDTSTARIADKFRVLVQRALVHLEGRGDPRLPPLRKLRVRNVENDRVADRVNGNHISILNESDRTAFLGFGDDVANDKAM